LVSPLSKLIANVVINLQHGSGSGSGWQKIGQSKFDVDGSSHIVA
jgi:hypothetical protein